MQDMNLSEVLAEALRRQRAHVAELEEAGSARDYNDAQKVLAQLVGQARALTKDAVRWAGALSPEERRECIASWFETLPLQQRQLLLQELLRIHNDTRKAG